jgi:hypothetical protein
MPAEVTLVESQRLQQGSKSKKNTISIAADSETKNHTYSKKVVISDLMLFNYSKKPERKEIAPDLAQNSICQLGEEGNYLVK